MSTLITDVIFRPLRTDDIPEILSWVQDEHFRSFVMDVGPDWPPESIVAYLSRDISATKKTWVIASDTRNTPIGAAWLLPSSRTPGTGFLNTYITPKARRASIGRRLAATCILRSFEKSSYCKVIMLVHGANTASMNGLSDWASTSGASLESVSPAKQPYKGRPYNIHRFVIRSDQQALLRSIV